MADQNHPGNAYQNDRFRFLTRWPKPTKPIAAIGGRDLVPNDCASWNVFAN